MDRFIFSYYGNKYREVKKYVDIDFNEYDIIAEPFCGIYGFSRVAFEKGFKGEFLLNDIDKELIDEFNEMKGNFDEYINKCKEGINKYDCDSDMTNDKNKSYNLKNICRGINPRLMSKDKGDRKILNFEKKKEEYVKMFEKCTFSNLNYKEFIEGLPLNKKILIFYDPPYFNSCNKTYQDNFKEGDYNDGTTMYLDILFYMKGLEHKQIFIMNEIAIINYLYKDFIKKSWGGTYGDTNEKKKTKSIKRHILFMN